MVRVISLDKALTQGETPASIDEIIKWHEAMLKVADRPVKQGKPGKRATSSAQHHREMIAALNDLRSRLESAVTAAAA